MAISNNSLISIVVPIYNLETYILNCIESIRVQTYSNIEVLLIDDGSSDESGALCDEFVKNDSRFRVIHQKNRGLSEARNIGLRIYKGDYLLFVDGDDYLHPRMIEFLYKAINEGDFSFSMGLYKKVNEYNPKYNPVEYTTRTLNRDEIVRNLYGNNSVDIAFRVCWNKLYKRKLLSNVFFNDQESEDTEFNNRIFLKCNEIIVVDAELYFYLQRPDSIVHTDSAKRRIGILYSYISCLNAIDIKNAQYRSYILVKLYKTMLYVKHYARNKKEKKTIKQDMNRIINMTYKEFISNGKIPVVIKYLLLFTYHFPIIYSSFVFKCEMQARLSKYIKK